MSRNVSLCHRGVWMIPGQGRSGESFLFVLDSKNHHITPPVAVPKGANIDEIGQGLWRVLDSAEPKLRGQFGSAPTFRQVRRRQENGLKLVSGRGA